MPFAAAITAIATVAAGYNSYKAGKAQQKYQEQQRQVQIRIDKLQARRSKIESFREKMRAQAEIVSQGVATGTDGYVNSSGYQGGISSLESQYAANQAFVNKMDSLVNYGSNLVNKSNLYQSRASMFSTVAGIAGDTFGGNYDLGNTMRSMFKT